LPATGAGKFKLPIEFPSTVEPPIAVEFTLSSLILSASVASISVGNGTIAVDSASALSAAVGTIAMAVELFIFGEKLAFELEFAGINTDVEADIFLLSSNSLALSPGVSGLVSIAVKLLPPVPCVGTIAMELFFEFNFKFTPLVILLGAAGVVDTSAIAADADNGAVLLPEVFACLVKIGYVFIAPVVGGEPWTPELLCVATMVGTFPFVSGGHSPGFAALASLPSLVASGGCLTHPSVFQTT
jgi:hypothetical protein